MRPYRDQILKRLFGTFVGIGFFSFGLFAVLVQTEAASEADADRAPGYGRIAIVASWGVKNLEHIWCRQPRRWRD
jgi:hypothetical protein